jgi:3-hydroxyacyl-[acyl-carrier-protein] dehydratase
VRFYLLDRIVEVVPRKSIRAAKLVSLLDPVLEHHPSAGPVLAPALVLEAINQAAGWIAVITSDFTRRLVPGVWRRIAISRPAPVGERLDITVEVDNWSEDGVEVSGEASCRGEPVVRAEGGLFFFVDAAEWEDPKLTRRHHGWIYRGDASLPDMPAPPSPVAGASVSNPGAYKWVPYDVLATLIPGEMAAARKSIVMTDSIFVNHFRRTPVVPGVFLIQSMLDVCRALLAASSRSGAFWRPATMQAVRFQKRVRPGDLLIIEARLKDMDEQGASLTCEGRVGGERAITLRSATFLAEPQAAALGGER